MPTHRVDVLTREERIGNGKVDVVEESQHQRGHHKIIKLKNTTE